jgi:hypothetical protein
MNKKEGLLAGFKFKYETALGNAGGRLIFVNRVDRIATKKQKVYILRLR